MVNGPGFTGCCVTSRIVDEHVDGGRNRRLPAGELSRGARIRFGLAVAKSVGVLDAADAHRIPHAPARVITSPARHRRQALGHRVRVRGIEPRERRAGACRAIATKVVFTRAETAERAQLERAAFTVSPSERVASSV
jgi:hypothetical protein